LLRSTPADLDWFHEHWRADAHRREIRVARDQLSNQVRRRTLAEIPASTELHL
jgi:hypothetical protein